MAQKPLFKSGKAKQKAPPAANRHGRIIKTKKGSLDIAPKGGAARRLHLQDQELTRAINQRNEAEAASKAAQHGGQLGVVRVADTKAGKGKAEKAVLKSEQQ